MRSTSNIQHRRACCDTDVENNITWIGGCNNQGGESSNKLKKINVTRMIGYIDTASVSPYQFPRSLPDTPTCSPFYDYSCGDRTAPSGYRYCGVPLTSDVITLSGTASFNVGNYHNNYIQSTESVDTRCKNIGFKSVGAHKAWHGKLPYNSRTYGQIDKAFYCGNCPIHTDDTNTIDDTMYRTLSGSSTYLYLSQEKIDTGGYTGDTCCGGTISKYVPNWVVDTDSTSSAYANNSVTIGIDTGNAIVTLANSGSVNDADGSLAATSWTDLGYLNRDITDVWYQYGVAILPYSDFDLHDTSYGSSHAVSLYIDDVCTPVCTGDAITTNWKIFEATVDSVGGTLTVRNYYKDEQHCNNTDNCTTCCDAYTDYDELKITVTATTFEYDYVSDRHISHSSYIHEERHIHGKLDDPYTAEEVHQTVIDLLDEIQLDDDDCLPWRTDYYVGAMPLVYYDETTNIPALPQLLSDTGSGTGALFGPCGPDNLDIVWNPMQKNYCVCAPAENPAHKCAYIQSYGGDNSFIGGGSYTGWTDNYEASNLVEGAIVSNKLFSKVPCSDDLVGNDYQPSRILYAIKHAQIVHNKQSFNYIRPCGADRFILTSGSCISSYTSTSVALSEPAYFENNDLVYCGAGDAAFDGIYTVNKVDEYSYNLTKLICSGSLLPSDVIPDVGTGVFAKYKFQRSGSLVANSICGYLPISNLSQSSSGSVTVTFSENHYCIPNDTITIQSNLLNINNASCSVIDNVTLRISGSISGSFASGIAYNYYSPDFKWNDVDAKGDYIIHRYYYNYRDVGEYNRLIALRDFTATGVECDGATPCPAVDVPPQPRADSICYPPEITQITSTQDCVRFAPCRPSVIFASPNGETFNNNDDFVTAKNYWDDSYDKTIDIQYGSTNFQIAFQQTMSDLYYETPICPCVDNSSCTGTYKEDVDGTCPEDSESPEVHYTAHRDVFEARLNVPDGAPPALVPMGVAPLNATDCNTKKVETPPYNYAPYMVTNTDGDTCACISSVLYEASWYLLKNRENCVAGDGRFATQYINNGIDTSDVVPAP